jgi:hypothetical protein
VCLHNSRIVETRDSVAFTCNLDLGPTDLRRAGTSLSLPAPGGARDDQSRHSVPCLRPFARHGGFDILENIK